MIDPVPVGYFELSQSVLRRAADVSDREYHKRLRDFNSSPERSKEIEPASLAWGKREFAIHDIYAALCDDSLRSVVRDPVSGEMFKLTASDWRGAAFWRDIIIGGLVRSSACEEIGRHDGRRVLLKADELDVWLKMLGRRQPQPSEEACEKWLEDLMRESPARRPKPKPELRSEAVRRFGVSGRKFDRMWDDKLKLTGANWGEPGAPSKL